MLPGASISIDTIVPLDSFHADNEVVPFAKYSRLHEDTASILGLYIGTKCAQTASPPVCDLEDLMGSFCQSLNMVLHQRTHNIDRRSITRGMLNAFLEAFIKALPPNYCGIIKIILSIQLISSRTPSYFDKMPCKPYFADTQPEFQ
jgi:hypothetical protein